MHGPIVPTRHQDPIVIDRERMDYGLVSRPTLEKASILTLPLFQTIRRSRHKRPFERRFRNGPDTLLVMRECRHALAGDQIPHFNRGIVRSGNDGRMRRLHLNRRDGVIVSRQTVHLFLGAHIPHSSHGIPSSRHEQIQIGMQRQTENTRQVSVIVANDLIGFQIPAFDLLVFAGTEEIGVSS